MSWDWDYQAGPIGSLEDLGTYCLNTRIVSESAAGRRGSNPVIEYRHGEMSTPRKEVRSMDLLLETVIRYTNSSGLITHADGGAGHVMENLGHLKRIFGGPIQNALTRLQRNSPDQGTVYVDVEMLGEANPSQARHIFTWPLHAPHPFWIGAADNNNATPTWTVGGDAPIRDAVIDFTGTASDPRVTHPASGAYIEIAGALPSGGIRVDIGAGTCVRISGGADWSQNLVVNKPWWMELDPGANAMAVTLASGAPTVTADWFTQWR